MNPNLKLAERNAFSVTIDPVSQYAGTIKTAWVSMGDLNGVCALLSVCEMSAGSTPGINLHRATDSMGSCAKGISGKGIVLLLAAGGNNRQILTRFANWT